MCTSRPGTDHTEFHHPKVILVGEIIDGYTRYIMLAGSATSDVYIGDASDDVRG